MARDAHETVDTGTPLRTMRHTRRSGDDAFRDLARAAAAAGLTLVTPQWQGNKAEYVFRCASGHEFTRVPVVLERGSTSCPQCTKDTMRQRFFGHLNGRDLVCIEDDYLGHSSRHRFRCAQGHEWATTAGKVMAGSGCPACANRLHSERSRSPDGLERLRQAAATHGGRCLSDAYHGIRARYDWECARGHRWSGTGAIAVNGSWCRWCEAQRKADTMRDPEDFARLQAVAASQGGQLMAKTWLGTGARYRFRCGNGHEWLTDASHVLRGTWCRQCAAHKRGEGLRSADGLVRLRAIAATHGGDMPDQPYVGIKATYVFRCRHGHEWRARGNAVLNGRWCGRCARRPKINTIERMQQVARERGGRCLSTEYAGSRAKLIWECHLGHVWSSTAIPVIYRGTWCPNCFRLRVTKNPRLRKRYDVDG